MLEGGRWDDSTLGVKKLGGWRQRVVKRGWRSPGKVCALFGAAYVQESVSFESQEGESEVGRHTHVLNFFFLVFFFLGRPFGHMSDEFELRRLVRSDYFPYSYACASLHDVHHDVRSTTRRSVTRWGRVARYKAATTYRSSWLRP